MSDYVVSPVWRLNDEKSEREAIEFWDRMKILPPGIDPASRAKELLLVARRGGELVGVATASIDDLPMVKSRFAMFRCSVAPEHRRSGIGQEMLVRAKPLLEQWSLEHPEKQVKGMGAVLEAQVTRANEPVWPLTGLTLVGYAPHGQQIRIAWFAHARV